jgi:hypothetical protein
MALELVRENGQRVSEVFQGDEHGTQTFTFFEEQAVPVYVVEWFLVGGAYPVVIDYPLS